MEVGIDFTKNLEKVETIRALGFLDVLLVNNGSIVTKLLDSGGTWCH
jgi:hypothetical protein